jgi:protein-tyrosine-phosphatase
MKVLFVCKGNVGRSQMAEAFFNHYTHFHRATSAGTHGEEYSKEVLGDDFGYSVVECMLEKGIDLSGRSPTQLKKEISSVDRIVWMTDPDTIPTYIENSRVTFWNVEDPKHFDENGYRRVRDQIERKVLRLINRIHNNL